MRLKDEIAVFLIGVWAGLMLIWTLTALGYGLCGQAKDALRECEKSLPRDQQCRIVAVPVTKEVEE